ncbi:chloramphenicol acetyltransferase [Aquimarina algiphila]|uniref:chloramphenicol acetyltransferase n=1 Tax=Aquimarina algiphila TaxID=2047982 RepID=UPI002491CB6D|nr:chloramphenicol acetyltransferase [Aquimarina algiphila]
MRKINLENWSRKEHFLNFLEFEDPFFNICVSVNVTNLKEFTKENEVSFFIVSFYGVLKAVNQIEEFRYRIKDEEVIVYEKIRGGCTILRSDKTFGFACFDYHENLSDFEKHAKEEIEIVKNGRSLDANFGEDDMIHVSLLPWISFNSIQHPRRLGIQDSVPKFGLGKIYQKGDEFYIPLSVSCHHALMDGLHVSEFIQKYEKFCADF